jgi:TRAP transporter TAXI family solute receptor
VFSIGTNPQGSLAYTVAAAIAKAAEAHTDYKFRIVPNSGPVVNLPLVNTGELDFAIGITTVTAFAINGTDMFKDRPNPEVEAAAYLLPIYAGAYARADSGIEQLSDLKGRRVPTEFTQQRITGLEVEAMLAIGGVAPGDVKGVPVPDGVRQIDEFINGRTDFFFFTSNAGKTVEADASVGGLRALSIPDTAETKAVLAKMLPGSQVETIAPRPGYPGISEPTNVLSLPFMLAVNKRVPEEVVYSVLEALAESRDLLIGVHGVFNAFDPARLTSDIGMPYHAGALKYAASKAGK